MTTPADVVAPAGPPHSPAGAGNKVRRKVRWSVKSKRTIRKLGKHTRPVAKLQRDLFSLQRRMTTMIDDLEQYEAEVRRLRAWYDKTSGGKWIPKPVTLAEVQGLFDTPAPAPDTPAPAPETPAETDLCQP